MTEYSENGQGSQGYEYRLEDFEPEERAALGGLATVIKGAKERIKSTTANFVHLPTGLNSYALRERAALMGLAIGIPTTGYLGYKGFEKIDQVTAPAVAQAKETPRVSLENAATWDELMMEIPARDITVIGDSVSRQLFPHLEPKLRQAGIMAWGDTKVGRTVRDARKTIGSYETAIFNSSVILVEVGTNSNKDSDKRFIDEYTRLLSAIREITHDRAGQTSVILETTYDLNDLANTRRVNKIIEDLAKAWSKEGSNNRMNVAVFDWAGFIEANGGPEAFGIHAGGKSKGKHADERGYRMWTEAITPILIDGYKANYSKQIRDYAKGYKKITGPNPFKNAVPLPGEGEVIQLSDTLRSAQRHS